MIGCRFATHHRNLALNAHVVSAEDYGDNLSEGEPCEPSNVHHAATIQWGWGPMQDVGERAALVAAARSQLGRELKAAQVKREPSARRRAIPFVSRIRAGEIRRKHDAHGAAALTRRTEKNDKWQVRQS
jgi:hypothetical protein